MRRFARRRLALVVTLGLGVSLVAGCESDSLKPPPVDERDLYWRLALNHHAVTLALAPPYDTLTLAATPRNVKGETLAGLPAPTYRSTDVATVRVAADGVLQAVAANSQPVWVTATLTAGNVRHVDSVLVRVVDLSPLPVLASFSIHPIPPDSAKTYSGVATSDYLPPSVLPMRATDASGTPFDSLVPGGIPAYFDSSDPTIARVDRITGRITGLIPDSVTFDASTTVFGVRKADTLPYRVGWPVLAQVVVTDGVNRLGDRTPPDVTIAAGGLIIWLKSGSESANVDTATVDVTFDDADVSNISAADTWPAAPLFKYFGFVTLPDLCVLVQANCASGGNIVLGPTASAGRPVMAFRAFLIPGVYAYRSVRYGVAGRVIVVDER